MSSFGGFSLDDMTRRKVSQLKVSSEARSGKFGVLDYKRIQKDESTFAAQFWLAGNPCIMVAVPFRSVFLLVHNIYPQFLIMIFFPFALKIFFLSSVFAVLIQRESV